MAQLTDKLPRAFYERPDVVRIARELLGMVLCTRIGGALTAGIITETEAYAGVDDRASHAYGGRHTERTRIMYLDGGFAYVYLIYGLHSLFNVVTHRSGVPHAVLVRSIYPILGLAAMQRRRNRQLPPERLCSGPGTVAQALGIHYSDSGADLLGDRIWIADAGYRVPDTMVETGPRIGVDYAGSDAFLPYRFRADNGKLKALLGH
jgi:DNA-3-methyladenine glycosylase